MVSKEMVDGVKLWTGTSKYLSVLYEFYDAYTSRTLTLGQRLEKLSFVLFFFRYWNEWLSKPPAGVSVSRDVNGISHQAMCDLEICVGAFYTIAAILHHYPRFQHTDGKCAFDPQRLASGQYFFVASLTEFCVIASVTGH